MRHNVDGRKLGRPTSHRLSMLKNLVTSLFERERLRTTVPKAKELRRVAERLITLAKRGELHHRRQALSVIQCKGTVKKLFDKIGPRFAGRDGGYTRIIRVGPRLGDGAEMAYLELIGSEFKPKVVAKDKKKGKKAPEESKQGKAEETAAKEPVERKRKGRDRGAEKARTHAIGKAQKTHVKAPGE